MTNCKKCGMRTAPGRRVCKSCAVEDRHGTAVDHNPDTWVLENGIWHASIDAGDDHECACGKDVSTPVEWVTEDLRYVPDEHEAPVCRQCVASIGSSREETVPEDAEFSRASELRADGGLEEVFRRETIGEAPGGGLQIGDRDTVDEIDDVCSALESLQEETDSADVEAALRSAVGYVWRASVLQRVHENGDIRMATRADGTVTTVHGPEPAALDGGGGDG